MYPDGLQSLLGISLLYVVNSSGVNISQDPLYGQGDLGHMSAAGSRKAVTGCGCGIDCRNFYFQHMQIQLWAYGIKYALVVALFSHVFFHPFSARK